VEAYDINKSLVEVIGIISIEKDKDDASGRTFLFLLGSGRKVKELG